MPAEIRELGPRGYYLAAEVGRLAGVSGLTIGQWARRGYIRSSQSEVIPRVYSYQDVAEAMVVHELLNAGVRHRVIKGAIAELRERYGRDWPLSSADLAVPADKSGAGIVSITEGQPEEVSPRKGQGILETIPLQEIAKALRRGGWAARELKDLEHIEINPDRLSGRPVIRGTRIPAEIAGSMAMSGDGIEVLKTDYELDDFQISDVRRWWERVKEYEAAA